MKKILDVLKSKQSIILLASAAVVSVVATVVVTAAKKADLVIEDYSTDLDA